MAIVSPAEQAARERNLDMVREAGAAYSPRFHDWLLTHYAMYLAFRAAADKVRERGLTEYSAYVIANVLRWQADIRGIQFSLSNTLIPDLARLYNAERGPLFKTNARFGKDTKDPAP